MLDMEKYEVATKGFSVEETEHGLYYLSFEQEGQFLLSWEDMLDLKFLLGVVEQDIREMELEYGNE
jgi:hypothetical protein